jgi:glucoamylase
MLARRKPEKAKTAYAWTFDHQILEASAKAALTISVRAPALLHWSTDEWITVRQDPARALGGGTFGWKFRPGTLPAGATLRFTFFWPEADRWEGRDFTITLGN